MIPLKDRELPNCPVCGLCMDIYTFRVCGLSEVILDCVHCRISVRLADKTIHHSNEFFGGCELVSAGRAVWSTSETAEELARMGVRTLPLTVELVRVEGLEKWVPPPKKKFVRKPGQKARPSRRRRRSHDL